MAPAAERKMKVVKPTPEACEGCEVMKLRDELLEQNINGFRLEMADRWRLQEEANKALHESVGKLAQTMADHVKTLNSMIGGYVDRVVKLEKSLVYVAIIVVVSALASWGAKLLP